MTETKSLIAEQLEAYVKKEECVILDEIARLGREGHLVCERVMPRVEFDGNNVVTINGALRLVLPKYDEEVRKNSSLETKLSNILPVLKRRQASDEACGHPFDEDIGELIKELES